MTKPVKLFIQPSTALFFALVFISLLLFHSAHARADSVTPLTEQTPEQQKIGKLTAELNQLLSRYRHASSDEQTQIEQQLDAIAIERQQLLAEVVESDPQTVLKYALPNKVQQQFPTQVQEKFEQWVHAQGNLEIYFEDHEELEKSRLRFYLKQDTKRFQLAVSGKNLPVQTSGHAVHVQGVMVNKGNKPVIATNDEQLMLAAGGSTDPNTSTAPTALDYTFGEQRTAVFLVNFQDKPTEKPWTKAEIENRFFTEISDFFWENSYQQTWLTGDVYGWYTVPFNSTDPCSLDIADAADAAAVNENIDLSQYQRLVYLFPKNTCTWAGFATVGGAQTRSWIHNSPYSNVPAHEIGHNLGLLHSRGLNCEGDVTDTNCLHVTYGDSLDTMGGNPGHFNAYQKERLGWLGHAQSPPIVTIEQAGSYSVDLYETPSSVTKALKVFKDIDPNYGLKRWYYIEYRQPVGKDEFIKINPFLDAENITNGLTVHMGTDGMADTIYLLDMTPESTSYSGDSADLWDPALVVGQSYTDSQTGLTITTEYTDSQIATFNVSYDANSGPTCNISNPLINVSPISSQWVSAGEKVEFTLSVTNQDSAGCPSVTYDVTTDIPEGWNVTNPQLTLAPGKTGSGMVSIVSASDSKDNFYEIIMTASNTENSSYSASTRATYVVSNGNSNTAPDAVNDNVTMSSIEPIVINVMSNDFDPDADAIYISAIGSPAKGDVKVNTNGTVIYTPAKRFKDGDSFTYTISDGQATDSATVSLTLLANSNVGNTEGNGGGKGGGKPAK